MAIKKKISELPESTDFKGLWTIGVNALNKSVKVSLEYIQTKINSLICRYREDDFLFEFFWLESWLFLIVSIVEVIIPNLNLFDKIQISLFQRIIQ